MATLREVRSRISGVQKTRKITRAMKMVAASKLRRAQTRIIAARPYARKMKELLGDLAEMADIQSADLIAPREVKNLALIVVTSDRGFCGAFNANLIRAAQAHIAAQPAGVKVMLICVGKKGVDYFGKRGYNLIGRHVGVYGHLAFSWVQSLAGEIIARYLKGEFDRVDVIYNEFKSISTQRILIEQFLPVPPLPAASVVRKKPVDYIYEPDRLGILLSILPRHLNFQIWRILLESSTAEEGARMAAMENATENAREMIATLQLQYNKARQTAITTELLEVVSGAEALRNAG
ncbi:MAG TPA: ATP synthase F1 subunit gamma [Bacteroidota bacterium]